MKYITIIVPCKYESYPYKAVYDFQPVSNYKMIKLSTHIHIYTAPTSTSLPWWWYRCWLIFQVESMGNLLDFVVTRPVRDSYWVIAKLFCGVLYLKIESDCELYISLCIMSNPSSPIEDNRPILEKIFVVHDKTNCMTNSFFFCMTNWFFCLTNYLRNSSY